MLDEVGAHGPLNTLLFGQVKSKLITEQWDEMRRVASSIRHGTVSASLLMRKLAAYPRQNQVARAVAHIAPLGWEHIRLIGDYHFALQSGRSLENLRPLHLQEEKNDA
ncbi:MAG: hypothetical protein NVSMB49_17200 [Ktedonobacteraceae bacterium]